MTPTAKVQWRWHWAPGAGAYTMWVWNVDAGARGRRRLTVQQSLYLQRLDRRLRRLIVGCVLLQTDADIKGFDFNHISHVVFTYTMRLKHTSMKLQFLIYDVIVITKFFTIILTAQILLKILMDTQIASTKIPSTIFASRQYICTRSTNLLKIK